MPPGQRLQKHDRSRRAMMTAKGFMHPVSNVARIENKVFVPSQPQIDRARCPTAQQYAEVIRRNDMDGMRDELDQLQLQLSIPKHATLERRGDDVWQQFRHLFPRLAS